MAEKKEKPEKKEHGRPTLLTPALGTEICKRLVSVGSLRKVCASADMPDKSTIFRWLIKAEELGADELHKSFRDQYAQARVYARDFSFDGLPEHLDSLAKMPAFDADGMPLLDKDGKQVLALTPASVQYAKLHLDAFKWQSSKENPKKYGEKLQTEQTGTLTVVLNNKDSEA